MNTPVCENNAENPPPATILVVDDVRENLAVIGDLLSDLYRVRIANSGARALRAASIEPRPDLILLDVMMPEMDGYAVLARLREDPATRDIPVIFVTALDTDADEQHGLSLGAVDYVTKPLHPAILLARVRTQIELKRTRDQLHRQNQDLEAEVQRRLAENLRLRDESEHEKARLNRQRQLILDATGEGIFGVDADDVITFINPAAAALLGYAPEELLGRPAHETIHYQHPDGTPFPASDCLLQSCAVAGVKAQGREDTYWRKDGSPVSLEFSCRPIIEDGRTIGAVATLKDVSERKRYLAQIERKANYDDLTGLPNRNLLRDRLDQAIARCIREGGALAALCLNLDRFNAINDTLGRDAGDQVLALVGELLRKHTRKMSTVARLDGDEFVLVATTSGPDQAGGLAQHVIDILLQPIAVAGHELYLSGSIGIAIYPKDGDTGEILLRNASAAMYKAKARGGNCFDFYATEMNRRALERLDLENGLRRALENRELIVHYQPQVNLRTGEIVGAEALVRWQHPEKGLLMPATFIPLAEETRLIVPLGEWVLRSACCQNKAWQDAGLATISVAVNMSAHQFSSQSIVELAGRILQETGLDPQYLELELTESAVMADAEAFMHATEKLKGLSIALSIDDFGTGFSSLSYLRRFAVDRLKVDQSFVRDVAHDPDSAAITLAIISLAHSLKLTAIAEGVETEAQLGFLRQHGCDEMQGFFFSRPLPPEQFEALLRERRKLEFVSDNGNAARTLLLVDDEPSILSSLRRLFRREGYKLLTATSGAEALEAIASHKVGVIVSDARMPTMDGPELLAKIRAMYPETVRIILSGYTDFKAVTEAVNRGELYKFMTKPWDDGELLETIRDAFRYYEQKQRRSGDPEPPNATTST